MCEINPQDVIDVDALVQWIALLQNEDGSFKGDSWGETDLRFTYSAIAALTILDKLDVVDTDKAGAYIMKCYNYDGAFGSVKESESHGAYTFCAIAALALLEKLHLIKIDRLGVWLAERQTPSGGFNGRPEKAPDVCYSWWILSALKIIDRVHWIDKDALASFITSSVDEEDGGIADRPGNVADVFHTFFGLAGLSLLKAVAGLKEIHPVYALPMETVEFLNLPSIIAAPESA